MDFQKDRIPGASMPGASTPGTSKIARIEELFIIPPFGRSAQADKQELFDSLQPHLWSAAEGSHFANHYADLFKRVHAKLLCDSYPYEKNQAKALFDALTSYILEQDALKLKIFIAAALIETNIPQGRQLGFIFWGIKHAPLERQEGTSHTSCFEWAGRVAAEDILAAVPSDISDILNECSQSLQELLVSEFESLFLEDSKQGPSVIPLYLKGYFEALHKEGDLRDEIDRQVLLDSYDRLFQELPSWTLSKKINVIFKDPTQKLEALLDVAYALSLSSGQPNLESQYQELFDNAQALFFQEPSSSAIIEYISTNSETLLSKYQQTPQTTHISQWVETMRRFAKIAEAVPEFA